MRRRLLNVLTVLSLLLAVTACALWARSYFRADALFASKQSMTGLWFASTSLSAWSGRGGLSLGWGQRGGDLETQANADDVRARTECDGRWHAGRVPWNWGPVYGDGAFDRAGRRTYLGFGVDWHDWKGAGPPASFQQYFTAVVPWPAVVAVLGVVPVVRGVRTWKRMRREGRIRAGLCVRCGYDLRASAGRCPECGEESSRNPEARNPNARPMCKCKGELIGSAADHAGS